MNLIRIVNQVKLSISTMNILLLLCLTVLGAAETQAAPIDFSFFSPSTTAYEGNAVNTQYSGSDNVEFSLRTPGTGTLGDPRFVYDSDPTIAEVGDPATAFTGPNINTGIICPQPPSAGSDQPSTASAPIIGCHFLTDDGLHYEGAGEPKTTLFIEYTQGVGQASGYIIDTDDMEGWRIEAYSVANPTFTDQPINTFVICGDTYSPQSDCTQTETEDGAATPWQLAGVCPSLIRSIAITYIGNPQTPPRNVGLGFDNFDANAGNCIPAKLEIEKTANGISWQAGGTGSYQVVMDVIDGDILPGSNIVMQDIGINFPSPPLTLTSITGPTGWNCTTTLGQCSFAVGSSPIPVGTTWTFTINVGIDSNYQGGEINNCVDAILQDGGPPENALLHDTNCAVVNSQPPVVTKEALNLPWQAGDPGTFQITVNITSDIPAGQSIAVHDVLPGGFTFVTGSIVSVPSSWNCNTSTGTCYLNGPITAGTPASLTFSVHVPEKCDTYANCADIGLADAVEPVASGVAWPDFTSLGQSCVEVPVIGCCPCDPADLHIKKTHSPASFNNGGTGTIHITVNNNGIDPVIAPIQVNDSLPAGLTMPPGPFSPAADIACVAGPQSPSPQQVQCAYMGNSGGNFSFDFQVSVDTDVNQICNPASVIKGCCSEEPNDKTRDCIPISKPETGRICGHKYLGKGTGHPLSGWDITATNLTSSTVYTAQTGPNGEYCIGPLPFGPYTVTEHPLSTGNNWTWTPINPSSGSYPGVIVSTSTPTYDFHNRKDKLGPIGSVPNIPSVGILGPITKKHSPSKFSTGSKGVFTIKVKNRGEKLEKGMLRVVDHMPGGLSVKTGAFRAGSWSCKGGMVTSSGQDVTCAYNRTLGKHSRATLHLNARVAPKGRFPAGVNEVENCATASVQSAAGVVAAGPKVCDKVRIRQTGKTTDILRGLAPLGGLIMQMPRGGGGKGGATAPVRKTPGAVR